MVAWNGIGINYGHQVSGASYSTAQVESDLSALASLGITKIRIAFPPYNDATGLIANCQDMVTRAKAHGFYVIWGVSTSGTITSTVWTNYKNYVTGTLATWAQTNGLSEMSLGNEVELHVDGSTLTTTTARSDTRSMATTVKAGGYTGKVSYQTSILTTYRTPWGTEGIGALDLIGWNSYDTLANFQSRNSSIVSTFGNACYISEFGCIGSGFSDYGDESIWYTDVVNRVASMQSAGVSTGYFFCYRDGGFGLTADTFALVLASGSVRTARDALKNVGTPAFTRFTAHV